MAWFYLLIAGIFEIGWVVGIKYCDGLKVNMALYFVIFSLISSLIFFWLAIKTIPLSIAYVVWFGIGAIGVVTYGFFILKEPISLGSLIFVSMIFVGVIGLKLQSEVM